MRRRHLYALLLGALALAASACDENLSTIAGPTPNLAPTFASIQRDVLGAGDPTGRRACIACHTANGRTPSGGLNLDGGDAYDRLVNAPSTRKAGAILVVPGDPEASYIVHKVEGRPGIVGGRMPFNGPYLTAGQILILKRWIEIGAPRN
jgi:mono/diheme cytochrome c family protein